MKNVDVPIRSVKGDIKKQFYHRCVLLWIWDYDLLDQKNSLLEKILRCQKKFCSSQNSNIQAFKALMNKLVNVLHVKETDLSVICTAPNF